MKVEELSLSVNPDVKLKPRTKESLLTEPLNLTTNTEVVVTVTGTILEVLVAPVLK